MTEHQEMEAEDGEIYYGWPDDETQSSSDEVLLYPRLRMPRVT